jgi:hypothetical protein
LEHGRRDVESYLDWLDRAALRREVLLPTAAVARYLPSLRDPATNRATRAATADLEPGSVLIVSGSLLLRGALPFDRVIHLQMSQTALARRTPEADAWTLEAYAQYETDNRPAAVADVVAQVDRRPPAVRGLPERSSKIVR